jgi:hypothetical protein
MTAAGMMPSGTRLNAGASRMMSPGAVVTAGAARMMTSGAVVTAGAARMMPAGTVVTAWAARMMTSGAVVTAGTARMMTSWTARMVSRSFMQAGAVMMRRRRRRSYIYGRIRHINIMIDDRITRSIITFLIIYRFRCFIAIAVSVIDKYTSCGQKH